MPFVGNDSQWPVVVDEFSGIPTLEDVELYNVRRLERLACGEPHVQVVHSRSGVRMPDGCRELIADFDVTHREEQRRFVAGVALVVSSPVLRFMLALLYRLKPAVYPRKPCATIDEARRWACTVLTGTTR